MRHLFIFILAFVAIGLYGQIPGTPDASGKITVGPPFVTGSNSGAGELANQFMHLYSGLGIDNSDSTGYLNTLTLEGDLLINASFAGLLGTKVTNTFGGAAVVAGAVHQLTNDQGYWGLIGMTNSGSTIGGGLFVNTFHIYNQGYGNTLNTVDGNKDFVWYSDPTDSHDFSALANEIMRLQADGGLDTDSISTDAIYYVDTYWDDLRVPLTNTKLNAAQSEPAFEEIGSSGLFAFAYEADNDSIEALHFIAQLPHKYKEGTDLDAHIHWTPSTTNAGDVRWKITYSATSINGDFTTTEYLWATDAADGTAFKHQLSDIGDIDGSALGISSVIIGSVVRLGDHADDTFTGIAFGLELDFHYEIDRPGSENETSKY